MSYSGRLLIPELQAAYRNGALSVVDLVETVLARIDAWDDPAVWITRVTPDDLRARARALDRQGPRDAPLFGIPFAVKDNIDIAGMATTAACPAFAYVPPAGAPVVERLIAAGAVLIGKTNLDQFATGLVGTRSPYGVPRNPFGAGLIPGGSSSGSAVAVAAGLVSVALGTDTAGSGRVPAAFNNILGLKPTRGLISTRGVVPACRSLDCVSIFALDASDALAVLEVAAAFDADDPFARLRQETTLPLAAFRFGVPAAGEREFFGDDDYARLYDGALATLTALGGSAVEVPFAPLRRAAALLYGGPWLAERLDATETLLARDAQALLPVTRSIIERGRGFSALDAHRAHYELMALRRMVEPMWRGVDVLALPTAGTIYTLAEVAAEPLSRNVELGLYTNFVNLLDLAAVAVPAGFRGDGAPFGLSLIAPAFADRALAALAARFQAATALPLGAPA
jgi:allophanate hydrolase